MIYIETGSCTPAVNLAYEEYFMKEKDLGDDLFMLWRDEPAIVVGRFQNTLAEVNSAYAEEHGIRVIRRISGGGTVYHDLGNLCFSLILQDVKTEDIDKTQYAHCLVGALSRMGVETGLTRRNDLTVGGKKISGNAMAYRKNRLLFHATLLFDANLDTLEEVLKSSLAQIETKGTRSVRSEVTNLKEHLPSGMDILGFKESLREGLFPGTPVSPYTPDQGDLDSIRELVAGKYETWEWNFGSNPNSKFHRTYPFPGGAIQVFVELEKGHIRTCRLEGDAGRWAWMGEIEKRLGNIRFTSADIQAALRGLEGETGRDPFSAADFSRWMTRF